MFQGKTFLRRSILLCAFSMLGCSQQQESAQNIPSQLPVDEQSSAVGVTQVSEVNAALLTLQELLGAADVQQALAQAAKDDDAELLSFWQDALLSAADEVDLAANERALISGKQGLQYLKFQGMKTNYQIAFERAFIEFEDVSKVYADYPAFENLHKRSMALVKQRDELVAKVAAQLKDGGYNGDEIEEAKRQWQNFFLSESADLQSLDKQSLDKQNP